MSLPVLPDGWVFERRPGGGYQARSTRDPSLNVRIGTDRWPNGHFYRGIGCSEPVCMAVDARNRLGDPHNPCPPSSNTKWHPPRERA